MSLRASTIQLGSVREYMWREVQNMIRDNPLPHEESITFMDENGQKFTVWVEISQDDVLPDVLSVTIMIDNYPCEIASSLGIISALFSIQNIEDCQIFSNGVQIQNTTNALNDMDLSDIESFVATNWNQ